MGFKLAIFISGRGSNMKEIVRACQRKELKSSIGLIVSNNIKAPGLLLPEIKNIPILTLDESNLNNKEFYLLLEKSLINNGIELICLAGFMKVLDKAFVNKWKNKIINIHPSLLPAFKGLKPQLNAIKSKVKYAGCTVHYVNEKIDSGNIIDQDIVKVDLDENEISLSKKILKKEHKLYIKVIKYLEDCHG